MWPIAFFGMTTLAVGVLAVASRNRTMVLGALGVASAVLLLGVVGTMMTRMQIKAAVENVDPRDKQLILDQGFKEANRPLQLAGGFAFLGLLLGGVAFPLSKKS